MANRPQQGGGVDREGPNREQQTNIGFRSVQLLKDKTLGIGAYGSVCQAICDNLLCAAKILHPTLFDPTAYEQIARHREHRLPIRRFEQECEFMSAIRHPNIVQYLGRHHDSETQLPVLLMELMDDSLTHFLESSQDPVPYHIQVNFCHDITLAISYLHLNSITHRDLSSNNVLLYGNVRAKVTDFGMAKLGDTVTNSQVTRITFTTCPGTDAYMPPEAVKDRSVYTAKIDCFAIGTLVIQILTRKFPKPGDRHKTVNTTDPRFPTLEVRVSEIERRQNHISEVDPNHPLLPIALDCLKDSDVERPSAQELCHRVAALKETPQYTESVRNEQEGRSEHGDTNEREDQITELHQQIQEKDDIIQEKDDVIQQVIQEKDDVVQKKDDIIQEKDDVIQKKDDIIQKKEDAIQRKDDIIQEKDDVIQKVIQEKDDVKEKIDDDIREQREYEYAQQIPRLQQIISSQNDDLQETIRNKDKQIEGKDRELRHIRECLETRQLEQSELQTRIQETIRNKDKQIEEKDRELRHIRECLETKHSELQTRIQELEQELTRQTQNKRKAELPPPLPKKKQLPNTSSRAEPPPIPIKIKPRSVTARTPDLPRKEQHHSDTSSGAATARETIKLRWIEAKKAPCTLHRGSDAVVSGNIVYLRAGGTRNIYGYNSTKDIWTRLRDCHTEGCSLAILNNFLTTIGGRSGGMVTNQLFSLTGEGSNRRWTELFQPMATKRIGSIAVCTEPYLVVAGGIGTQKKILRTVEVMDTATQQWSTAADLPGPLYGASVTICGNRIYMLGGHNISGRSTKSVYTCSISDLCQSSQSGSLQARSVQALDLPQTAKATITPTIWDEVAELTAEGSTCVTLQSRLLAIGGRSYTTAKHGTEAYKSQKTPTPDIHMYNPTSNAWEQVTSKMTYSRQSCFAAVLPNNQLMVVGGFTADANSVEIASVV